MTAHEILDIFWSDKPDSLNFFKELTMQKRIADAWFDCFLQECRSGSLTDEMYNFLMGLPTRHCGSWLPKTGGSHEPADDPFLLQCYNNSCAKVAAVWAQEARAGST